jgi:hypothetical protein
MDSGNDNTAFQPLDRTFMDATGNIDIPSL